MKKIGRPLIMEKRNISAQKVIRAYQMLKSTRKAAAVLKISNWKVWHVLEENGIPRSRQGLPDGVRWKKGKISMVERWKKKNKDVILPTDTEDLMQLTGCTKNSAKRHITRMLMPLRHALRDLPLLTLKNVALYDHTNALVATRDILQYRAFVDRKTYLLKIEAILKDGTEVLFEYDEEDIPKLFDVLSAGPSE
jgi:hypothetical protein